MAGKKPFYKHTSILLALSFVAGVGTGAISDSLTSGGMLETSVIQNSGFVKSLVASPTMDHSGQIMAYALYNGNVVDDRAGDDETAPTFTLPPSAVTDIVPDTVPAIETPQTSQPTSQFATSCEYTKPDKLVRKATPVQNSQLVAIDPSGAMRVSILYKNDGNTPWFADGSGCSGEPVVQLGTARDMDRTSIFFGAEAQSGWADANRVYLSTPRVDPGNEGTFTFALHAPSVADLYREYFSVVVPGATWINDSESYLDIVVGQPYDQATLSKKISYLNGSDAGVEVDLNAAKSVEVDLSEQRAYLKLGDYVVRTFLVSSGSSKHPTPTGSYKVLFKQQVRIGGASPFYIMPKWQAWRPDGYGFHALPALGSASLRARIRALGPDEEMPSEWLASDTMWTEAKNHLGSPRSHGCIRFGAEEAAFLYDYTDVGTVVVTHS